MTATVVHPQPRFRPAHLTDPPSSGYLQLAASVEPPSGRAGRPGLSPRKTALLDRLRAGARELAGRADVLRANVFRAVAFAPPSGFVPSGGARPARYDVAVLVETHTRQDLPAVQESAAYQAIRQELADASSALHVMPAYCAKCIADVDRGQQGLFLFNYFVAEDPEVALDLWDHLAGWYETHTRLDNSVLLRPLDSAESDYCFVNHARYDTSIPMLVLRQLVKPSFYRFVQRNMKENRTTAMPVLYRLVQGPL